MRRLLLLLLLCCCLTARLCAQQTQPADSLHITAPSSLEAPEQMTLPYTNWYCFEKPEAQYGKRFLKESIAPLAVGLVGLGIYCWDDARLEIQDALSWHMETQRDLGADRLRYAPYAACAVLPMFGLYPKHKPLHSLPLAVISYCFADLCVNTIKNVSQEQRPHESLKDLYNSFPSQHTSEAFIAATYLHHEYGQYSPWISVGGYLCAAYVGYARIAADYHWSNDVLVGAAIGTLCTHLVYFAYDGLSDWISSRRHDDRLSLMPYATSTGGGLFLSYEF